MTIRYQCEDCGSVLKIKDELAGTKGKCPKCHKKFIVPEPNAESGHTAEESADSAAAAEPAESKSKNKQAAPVPQPAAAVDHAKPPTPKNGDDFDLDAFLMEAPPPGAKSSAGLATPPPPSPAAQKPLVDKQGRRVIAAPPPSPGSSAEMPTHPSGSGASNASANARDLLTKTMEEGKVKASGMPPTAKKRRFNFNVKDSLAPLKQYAAYIVGGIVLIIGLYWVSNRMMSDQVPLPQLAPVTGTVNVNGTPLAGVIVHLTPVNAAEGKSTSGKPIRLRDATGGTDSKGYFEIEYMDGIKGAPLGRARIWLQPLDPADFGKIPHQYLAAGSDMRDVKEAHNEGKFDLDLKKP